MNEDHEPIIDALLEEVLGSTQPPDLTRQILDAYHADGPTAADAFAAEDTAPAAMPTVHIKPRRVASTVRTDSRYWNTWASAAVVFIGASLFGYWFFESEADHISKMGPPPQTLRPDASQQLTADSGITPPSATVESGTSLDSTDAADQIAAASSNIDATPSPAIDASPAGEIETEMAIEPRFIRNIELRIPQSENKIVAFVNRQLKDSWDQASITPAPAASDAVWLRRASSFLVGRSPTQTETQQFARNRDRQAAIEGFLNSGDFATHWSNVLSGILLSGGSTNAVDSAALSDWLAQSLDNDKPYDQIAFELITASGSAQPGSNEFNAAVNFLLAHQRVANNDFHGNDPSQKIAAVNKLGQVFLGKQMQCAQCHDHPSNAVSQQQYFEFAAFLTQMQQITPASAEGSAELVDVDYLGTDGDPDDADLFFVHANGKGVSVYPRYLDGTSLSTLSGRISKVNRRAELANRIIQSNEFALATVNRLWDLAFGTGFTSPVDDMGPHNPPSHPELLRQLSEEFRNSQFSLKSALKWITLSTAFDRQERSVNQLAGRPHNFSSFASQDIDTAFPAINRSLSQLATRANDNGTFGGVGQEINAQLGSDDSSKADPQKLAREERRIAAMLGERLLQTTEGSLLAELARNEKLSDQQRVRHLFLATVGRPPTRAELTQSMKMFEQSQTMASRQHALKQVGWVLLNSLEYRTHH